MHLEYNKEIVEFYVFGDIDDFGRDTEGYIIEERKKELGR